MTILCNPFAAKTTFFQRLGLVTAIAGVATIALLISTPIRGDLLFVIFVNIVFWTMLLISFLRPRGASAENHVRGNRLAPVSDVQRCTRNAPARFALGEINVPTHLETRHFLFAGTTGSGKTRLFHQVLQPSRNTAAKAIVVDIGGAMCSRYYRDGDVIFNPRDARSVPWSPLAEIKDIDDVPLIAKSIIPDGNGSAAEWNKYAQRLLEAVLQRAWETGGNNGEIVRLLTRATTEELREVCAGLPAEGMLRDGNERMLSSVLAIIATYVAPLAVLPPEAGSDAFSVTDFVADDTHSNWLYLNFLDRQIEQLKPIICSVISVAISSLLSLKEDANRRVFFVLDEFDALGEISGIKSLLTRGRRFGGSAIIAIQSVSQLYECYGRDAANTLLSNLGTQVILRLPDAETAEWASRTFGEQDIIHTAQSRSSGPSGRSSSSSEQLRTQRVVMPSEIQSLPDLRGLLNIVGDIPPCVINIPAINPQQIAPEFSRKTA